MAYLEILHGPNSGQIYPLDLDRTILGRHPTCGIVLDDNSVSRQHAQITQSHGACYVEDLRSRNGTQVNDQDVRRPTALRNGDVVRVCDHTFVFRDADGSTSHKPIVSSLPSAGSSRETLSEAAASPEPGTDSDELEDRSSIIKKIDATSGSGSRLNVKPEVKLRAILEIGKCLNRTLKLEAVLPSILEALFNIYPQADQAGVLLVNEATGEPELRASHNRRDDDDSAHFSRTVVQRAMKAGEAILSADASEDSRFSTSESLAGLRIRSMMCAPLVTHAGERIGAIQITSLNLAAKFQEDDLDLLVNVAGQCAMAVENANLYQEVLRQRDIERDLEFAMQVQLGFLPNKRPQLKDYEFADYYEAAQHVGGDYFDYITMSDGRLAVTVADVAGKGVPAALLMARLYSAARYHLLTSASAEAAMTGLNAEIATSGLGHRFITCLIAIVDPVRHEATVVTAGHLPPMVRGLDGRVTLIDGTEPGLPLGIIPDQVFHQDIFPIRAGDTWLLYTDGVTEAMTVKKELYGGARLEKFVTRGPFEIESLVKGIVGDVVKFVGDRAQSDDLCLVGFQRNP